MIVRRASGGPAGALHRASPAPGPWLPLLAGKFRSRCKESSRGEGFVYPGSKVYLTSGIYPLIPGRPAGTGTRGSRAYPAGARGRLSGRPVRTHAESAIYVLQVENRPFLYVDAVPSSIITLGGRS
jgi:hypothetical protein